MVRIGITGTGKMARKMAYTLSKMENAECTAVASRSVKKGNMFSEEWEVPKIYLSVSDMVRDSEIDLIYVATPHSAHYSAMKMCLEQGKPVICEKAFTTSYGQASEIINLAESKRIFVTEAMWMRYLPVYKVLKDLVGKGVIGMPQYITADICYPINTFPRMLKPSLDGGVLLDIGVYALNFAAMFFEGEPEVITGNAVLTSRKVDAQENISLVWQDGKMAALQASMMGIGSNTAQIVGTKGYIIITDFMNPTGFLVYDAKGNRKEYNRPVQITGYEYEIAASIACIMENALECPEMPHGETLKIMRWMDTLRKQFGVEYPDDKKEQDFG